MVQLPEKAPDWQSIIKKNFNEIHSLHVFPEIQSLIEKTDRHYYYWNKIRSQPLPKKFDKEDVWTYIRFRRQMNSNAIPLEDIKGQPFTFWLTDFMQKSLHLIDQNAFGNLSPLDQTNDKKTSAKFMISSLMDEAITSSQIEGAAMTIKDAKKMLLETRTPKSHSEKMIYNNYLTMQSLKEICNHDLDLQTILNLHALITKDTLENKDDEGKFRKAKDNVNVVTTYGEVLFTPPPAEEIHERIASLIRFANDKNDKLFIHPIVKAIILHFWMAYVHPFVDGNGRMARTLFYWYVLKHKYMLFEYMSISKIILKKTAQYANAYLQSEHDDNDMTYFIHFHIEVIKDALEELKRHILQEKEKNQKIQLAITEHPQLNLRQARIIQHLIKHRNDILTIKVHQNSNSISYQTARTDLLELVEKGWLKMVQRGKAFYFIATEDLSEKYNA